MVIRGPGAFSCPLHASIPEVISWSAWAVGCSLLQPPGGRQEEGPRTRGPSPGEAVLGTFQQCLSPV